MTYKSQFPLTIQCRLACSPWKLFPMQSHRDLVHFILNFHHPGLLPFQSCRIKKMWIITWDILGTRPGKAICHFYLYSINSFLHTRINEECWLPVCPGEKWNDLVSIWQRSYHIHQLVILPPSLAKFHRDNCMVLHSLLWPNDLFSIYQIIRCHFNFHNIQYTLISDRENSSILKMYFNFNFWIYIFYVAHVFIHMKF